MALRLAGERYGVVSDHGELDGLGDDDHTQYLNTARHDITDRHPLGSVVPHDDHGALSGLGDDDHSQYFLANGTREASKVVITDGAGHFLQVPKLTTTERDGLTPVNGMLIYNTTTNQFERYEADAWGAFGGGGQTYHFIWNIEPQESSTTSQTAVYWTPPRCWKSHHNLGDIFSGKTIDSVKLHWTIRLKTTNATVYARLRVSLPETEDWKYSPWKYTASTAYVTFRGTLDITPTSWIQNGKALIEGCFYAGGASTTVYQEIGTVILEVVAH